VKSEAAGSATLKGWPVIDAMNSASRAAGLPIFRRRRFTEWTASSTRSPRAFVNSTALSVATPSTAS
jgi:hypothetical protein